jgi:hypothetical protein
MVTLMWLPCQLSPLLSAGVNLHIMVPTQFSPPGIDMQYVQSGQGSALLAACALAHVDFDQVGGTILAVCDSNGGKYMRELL